MRLFNKAPESARPSITPADATLETLRYPETFAIVARLRVAYVDEAAEKQRVAVRKKEREVLLASKSDALKQFIKEADTEVHQEYRGLESLHDIIQKLQDELHAAIARESQEAIVKDAP